MTTFSLKYKASTDEWVVVVKTNGARVESRCYYTNNKEDAQDTMKFMKQEQKNNEAKIAGLPIEDTGTSFADLIGDNDE